MTTLQHYSGINDILGQLELVRSRQWAMRLVTALLAVATITMASLLVVGVALGYWPGQPPTFVRWILMSAACLAIASAVGWYVVRALLWRQNPAQIARFIEQALPDMRNDLINSVLLAQDRSQSSPELVQGAIAEAARRAGKIDVTQSVRTTHLKRWGLAAFGTAVVLVVFGSLQGSIFHRGLMGMSPTVYLPTVNGMELVSLTPGDTRIFAGESVTITAQVKNDSGRPLRAELLFKGADVAPRPMIAAPGNSTYTCVLSALDQTTDYSVKIGSDRWPAEKPFYTITVVKRVKVESMDLRFDFPPYTGLQTKSLIGVADGGIEAPMGTVVNVKIILSDPVPAAKLEIQNGASITMKGSPDRMTYEGALPVDKDGAYRILLNDDTGHALQQLPDVAGDKTADLYSDAGRSLMNGYYRMHAVPDEAPKVEFLVPNRDTPVAPGGKLETKLKAFDKYGLTGAAFYAAKEGQEPRQVYQYDLGGKKDTVLDYSFRVDSNQYAEGDVIVYYATATDNRTLPGLGYQTAKSSQFKVLVQDPTKVAEESAKRLEEVRKALEDILKLQMTHRVNTGVCLIKEQLKQVTDLGAVINGGQKAIKAALVTLAGGQFPEEMVQLQQAVALLGNNEAQIAIDQSQALATVADLAGREKSCSTLAATQDKIIDTLQLLMSIVPSLANKNPNADKKKSGADMPPDVQEKLKALDDQLKKFIDEQRKSIEASKSLSKKAADNFRPEDDNLLKETIATQDKWEKFMEEAVTDFSKLAQQDYSNPQLMKELLSVKSDVTMAKDALKAKAAEMATAAEDNGVSQSKSLTSNIEKWLPDTPNRAQWKLEDPTDGMNTNPETPNLPSELEDLVGDLLEGEEDLFDEMESQTSKYAASMDKGVGWGAGDGPMSSMNAQGVTGNQLPSPNEMSGRSGEGRTGKSSGEFVEDKAVGKGGRRTPTRLTPEPFQKGQIDDKSAEPPGGSTGGGKISGSGADGLEGPLPPPVEKEMERLAAKQADLMSKGKKFLENYKPNDFSNFRLLQAITLMGRVSDDLDNHRYQNALRQKDVTLDGLKGAKTCIDSRFDVSKDNSAAMPKYVKDNIADAMKGKMPEEYRDVLEHYYRRLGEAGGQ